MKDVGTIELLHKNYKRQTSVATSFLYPKSALVHYLLTPVAIDDSFNFAEGIVKIRPQFGFDPDGVGVMNAVVLGSELINGARGD